MIGRVKNTVLWLGLSALLFSSCNPTRRLQQDQLLLNKNTIKVVGAEKEVSHEDLEDILKQKPNRSIFFHDRFYLWAWNLYNKDSLNARELRKQQRIEEINQERLASGKKPKKYHRSFGRWVQEVVGEPPVIFDTTLARKSAEQLRLYVVKHGWFNATASYSYKRTPQTRRDTGQKVDVTYKIIAGKPYYIDTIEYHIPDERIVRYMKETLDESDLVPGVRFQTDLLDNERKAITDNLRQVGYFTLSKEYFYYRVDTTLGNHKVMVDLVLTPWNKVTADPTDSTRQYPVYHIKQISLLPKKGFQNNAPIRDTIAVHDYQVIESPAFKVKPKVLTQNILFKPGDLFNAEEVNLTYRRLSQLPYVSAVNISFTSPPEDSLNNNLNCTIALSPAPKQNVRFEINGTNNAGNLGINGKLGYLNRNFFRGSELFQVSLAGGIEAQQLLTSSSSNSNQVGKNVTFNTKEFGPELSLRIPHFLLPLKAEKFAKSANPATVLSASFNYQQRPDYLRRRLRSSLSYAWNETDFKQWIVTPIELSLIDIAKSSSFEQQLQAINDPYLTNSYSNQFIPNGRITYIFNNQSLSKRKRVLYYRADLESSGLLWRLAYNLTNAPKDDQGSYRALNIRFAHYIKLTQEIRVRRNISDKTSVAYRFLGGLGVPLVNLHALPFEKSYYGGGANDIRAWQARTLGPGSYRDLTSQYDRIGDIQLEGNVEYRFKLISLLEGALFMDAGNIWLLHQTTQEDGSVPRPGATFKPNKFMSEIAMGGGVGLRLNFTYFLIRFDLALQLKDPSLDPGERWLFQPKSAYNQYIDQINQNDPTGTQFRHYHPRLNFNIGIGYPF